MKLFTWSSVVYLISFHIYSIKAIIGGQNAQPGEFSYIVSLRNETGLHYCGGVLITRKHVVTVAHCLYTDESTFKAKKEIKYQPKDVKVLVNTVYADGTQSNHFKTEIIPAEKLTPHPNYRVTDPSTIADDIAIITLQENVSTDEVVPIQLSKRTLIPGDIATIAGWGVRSAENIESYTTSHELQKLTVTIESDKSCKRKFKTIDDYYPSLITKSLKTDMAYCMSSGNNTGSCIRDSGGPVVADGKLVGLIAYGIPCATGTPDVFTAVAYYEDFIKEQIR